MKTKMIVAMVMVALVASTGVAAAHNEGVSGIAYPGIPFIEAQAPGDAVRYGFDGYDSETAYAGRPYIESLADFLHSF